jgi:hypothetical protein
MRQFKPCKRIHIRTVIAFLLTFFLCAVVGFIAIQNIYTAEKERLELLILEHTYRLNEVISRQLYRTQALAALVIKGDGAVEDFQEIAAVIAADVPALAAFLLAPGGIVIDAYPLEDNPTVVGLNFLDELDHDGNREAIIARDTGELVMGGPFVLRSGIMGLTGRYPVYMDTGAGSEFWGLVAVSLKFPEALDGAALSMLEYQGLTYELWRINPDTNERQVIATNNENGSPNVSYVERAVYIHHAQWYFRIYPMLSWYQHPETWILFLGALSISLFVAFVMQAVRQKELELTHSKVAIMLTQIQPHFLYNALAAIAQLCKDNPAKAEKATIDFSTYLRGNMESLGDKGLITVEKELLHVKGYLDLEAMIYDDTLHVVYNIESGGFMLPPLTIQPIVENAVKHGVGQKEDGGTVTVSVRETDTDYLVIVSDDGVGFDTSKPHQDDREHIGVENVRRRLKEQCGGTLVIESEPGIGTTVTMKLPKGV